MSIAVEDFLERFPELDPVATRQHFTRLPERYFECFDEAAVWAHLSAAIGLTERAPIQVDVLASRAHEVGITLVSCDYPGLLSLYAGVLAALGVHIQSGDIFTYSRLDSSERRHPHPRRHPVRSDGMHRRRKVFDSFHGTLPENLDAERFATLLQDELVTIGALLESRKFDEARQYVSELVVRSIHEGAQKTMDAMPPVVMTMSVVEGSHTVMEVVALDTPIFLYSLSAALALQSISVERVSIAVDGDEVRDVFEFVDRQGKPVVDPVRLDQIKLSVAFTKHFTFALPMAPDPYHALTRFEHMIRDVLSMPDQSRWLEVLSNPESLGNLARVLGASDFMWEDFIRNQYELLLPILQPKAGDHFFDPVGVSERLAVPLVGVEDFDESRRIVNAFKDEEMFLIDMDNILGAAENPSRLMAGHLNLVTRAVIGSATHIVYDRLVEKYGAPRSVGEVLVQYAVMGLGKCGGVALGYASDIELLFVYSDAGRTDGARSITNAEFFDFLVQDICQFIETRREGIFEIDLRLRPHGKDGPLATSLQAFCEYYGPGGDAMAYTRLALVRMRRMTGGREFCQLIERLRDDYVYASQDVDVAEVREIRARQYQEKGAGSRLNAKYSRGALVDLEYDVQILQVTHGGEHPELRTPRIHRALDALASVGVVDQAMAMRLTDSYYFLRRLIDGMRMLRGNAKDLYLPPEGSTEYVHLARRMGYTRDGQLDVDQLLTLDFQAHTAAVRHFVRRHFGYGILPGSGPGNIVDLLLDTDAPEERVVSLFESLGFRQPLRALENFRLLGGYGEQLEQFLHLALLASDRVTNKADPDMALNNWTRFVEGLDKPAYHFRTLLKQPARLDILLSVFSSSQFLADLLIANSDFFDWVSDSANLNRPLTRSGWVDELRACSQICIDYDEWMETLRRLRRREMLRITVRDFCLGVPIEDVVRELSVLADGVVDVVLERIWEEVANQAEDRELIREFQGRLSILGFGKLGGRELNYSSDIDIVGVYVGDYDSVYGDVMKRLCADLSKHVQDGHAYRVDLRLRPHGSQGTVVSSVDAIRDYYESIAKQWEVQALLKARPVGGNLEIGASLLNDLAPKLCERRDPETVNASINTMRDQVTDRLKKRVGGSIDVKDGVGGIRDIEFLVQGLQMRYCWQYPDLVMGNTLEALSRLVHHSLVSGKTETVLADHYRYLRRVEHFLQVLDDRQVHELPKQGDKLDALARRMEGRGADGATFVQALEERLAEIRGLYEQYLHEL